QVRRQAQLMIAWEDRDQLGLQAGARQVAGHDTKEALGGPGSDAGRHRDATGADFDERSGHGLHQLVQVHEAFHLSLADAEQLMGLLGSLRRHAPMIMRLRWSIGRSDGSRSPTAAPCVWSGSGWRPARGCPSTATPCPWR